MRVFRYTVLFASVLLPLTFSDSITCEAPSSNTSSILESLSHPLRFIGNLISDFYVNKYRRLVPELFVPLPTPPAFTKVVIIGSGFGGSIAALRLGQAGVSTTVVERGQSWPIHRFRDIHAYEPVRDGRGLWHRTSSRAPIVAQYAPRVPVDFFGGVLDITEYENIEVWRAACVGGGSKVFTGVMIQPEKEYFQRVFGDLVSFDQMNQTYYPRVRRMLNLSAIPEDLYVSKPFGHSRIWDQQARKAGYEIRRPDSAFNWEIIRDEIEGRARKSATIGMSNMGNGNGAKFDVTQNYLKEAVETGNVRVFSNQLVTDIENHGSEYLIHINNLSPTGHVINQYSIRSEFLILSAGSIGSTELLVKAKEKGLIQGLNSEIGKGWGSNGDSIVTRSFNLPSGVLQAAPSTSIFHDKTGPNPTTYESWYVPGLPSDLGIQGSLCLVFDDKNRGEFVYDHIAEKVNLIWSEDASKNGTEACRRINNHIATANKLSIPGAYLLAPDVWSGFTAHPLGGAVLGKATDSFGRVKGAQNLYVMDGAVIPGSTGAVNPSLTISALTERNIGEIIKADIS